MKICARKPFVIVLLQICAREAQIVLLLQVSLAIIATFLLLLPFFGYQYINPYHMTQTLASKMLLVHMTQTLYVVP